MMLKLVVELKEIGVQPVLQGAEACSFESCAMLRCVRTS